jgi:hypothetical protein
LVYKNSKPDFVISTHRPLMWVSRRQHGTCFCIEIYPLYYVILCTGVWPVLNLLKQRWQGWRGKVVTDITYILQGNFVKLWKFLATLVCPSVKWWEVFGRQQRK